MELTFYPRRVTDRFPCISLQTVFPYVFVACRVTLWNPVTVWNPAQLCTKWTSGQISSRGVTDVGLKLPSRDGGSNP